MRGAVLSTLLVAFAACGSGSNGDWQTRSGTVLLLEDEGGIYGVLGDDGVAYEPLNLPARFAIDGMRIRFDWRPLEGEGVWGKPVDISDVEEVALPAPGPEVNREGTVLWVDLEGGFYGILGDDGQQYDPLNLPMEYQVHGLRVTFAARIRDDLASAHMWGYLITIESIDRAEA
jgi:hypothetical protein